MQYILQGSSQTALNKLNVSLKDLEYDSLSVNNLFVSTSVADWTHLTQNKITRLEIKDFGTEYLLNLKMNYVQGLTSPAGDPTISALIPAGFRPASGTFYSWQSIALSDFTPNGPQHYNVLYKINPAGDLTVSRFDGIDYTVVWGAGTAVLNNQSEFIKKNT